MPPGQGRIQRFRTAYRTVSARKTAWLLLKDTVDSCMEHRVTGLAAEAGFFTLLSLPPLLLSLVGALGYLDTIIGTDTIDNIRSNILTASGNVLTQQGVDQLVKPLLKSAFDDGRPDLISIGFVIALWSGSRALNVFVDTITIMYGLEGRRGIVRTRLLSFMLYVIALVIGAVVLPLMVAGPDLVVALLPDLSAVVKILYWPVTLLLSVVFLTTLYHVAVPVRTPWREDIPGALVALLMWVLGSFLLRIYLTHTVEGPSLYGSLAAPVAVLLWIGVSAFAVLIGAAVNAAIDRVWPSLATAAAREENARAREAAAAAVVAEAAARRAAAEDHGAEDDDEDDGFGPDVADPPAEFPERWAHFLPPDDLRAHLPRRGARRPGPDPDPDSDQDPDQDLDQDRGQNPDRGRDRDRGTGEDAGPGTEPGQRAGTNRAEAGGSTRWDGGAGPGPRAPG